MKSLVLIFVCMVLIGCSDNKKEIEELEQKHEQALAELEILRGRELQRKHEHIIAELQIPRKKDCDNDKNAFADAISKPSIDERYEALNQFIKACPSSSLLVNARQEIRKLEKLIENRNQRDHEIAEQTRAIKLASQREQERKKAEEEKRLALKKRCIDLARKGVANMEELQVALFGMTELELISLIGKPDRVEQRRTYYYYRGIGIETATGKKRGIIVTLGGGTSLEPRVNMVRWRI